MNTKRNVGLSGRFLRDVKYLKKKYPRLQDDLKPLIEQLESGETPGDRIPDLNQEVYKVRLSSRDQQRGKRGGFRVIYYVQTSIGTILLSMYAKADQDTLSPEIIRQIITELETLPDNEET